MTTFCAWACSSLVLISFLWLIQFYMLYYFAYRADSAYSDSHLLSSSVSYTHVSVTLLLIINSCFTIFYWKEPNWTTFLIMTSCFIYLCYLLSSWYSWKIAHLTLNNNHSLFIFLKIDICKVYTCPSDWRSFSILSFYLSFKEDPWMFILDGR